MKHLLLSSIFFATLLAGATQVSAQERLVTVDVKRVTDNYYKKQQLVNEINASARQKSMSLDSRKATYQKLTSEMVKLDRLMNDPSRSEKARAESRQKLVELSASRDATANEIADATRRAEQQIMQEKQNLENSLTRDIQLKVAEVAKAKGYDLAFDKSFLPSTSFKSILYASSKVPDITDEVIAALNQSAPSQR